MKRMRDVLASSSQLCEKQTVPATHEETSVIAKYICGAQSRRRESAGAAPDGAF